MFLLLSSTHAFAQKSSVVDLEGLQLRMHLKDVERLVRETVWSDSLQPDIETGTPMTYRVSPGQLVIQTPRPVLATMKRDVVVMLAKDSVARIMLASRYHGDRADIALRECLDSTQKLLIARFGKPERAMVSAAAAVRALAAQRTDRRFVEVATWRVGRSHATVILFLARDPAPPRERLDFRKDAANIVFVLIEAPDLAKLLDR